MKNKMLIAIICVLVITNLVLAYLMVLRDTVDYKAKYKLLCKSYVSLASVQKNMFEVLMTQVDLKRFFPEYKDMTEEQFEEAVRRKIVKLEIEIKEMEKE